MSKKTQRHTPNEQASTGEHKQKPSWQGKALPLWPLPWLYCLAFAVLGWFYLADRNAETLFYLQERGYWNNSMQFFSDCMQYPGGLLSWAGAYLTQYCFFPKTGAALLIVLWLITFWIAKLSFRIKNEWSFVIMTPLVALLCTQTQLGYWVYFMKDIDYCFYHTLGLLLALIISIDFPRLLPEKWQMKARVVQSALIIIALYRPMGHYSIVAAGVVAARTLRMDWRWGLGAVATTLVAWGIVPIIQTSDSTMLLPDDRWTYGFRKFELANLRSKELELPFLAVSLIPLLLPLLRQCRPSSGKMLLVSQIIMLLMAIAAWHTVSSYNAGTVNFNSEIRMASATMEQRWDDVLAEAGKAPSPTRVMILLRDIALMNKHQLHNRYEYNNKSAAPTVLCDSVLVRIGDQYGDLIYYSFGETNFAIRRNIERTMHYGYSYYTMKLLTQCAIVNGEYDVARKYLDILDRTTFQRRWAARIRPMLEDTTRIAKDERFRIPFKFHRDGVSQLGSDDYYVEPTLLKLVSNSPSYDPETQDVTLLYSMQDRSPSHFWPQLFQWMKLNPGRKMPPCIQEAAIMFHRNLNTGPDLGLIPIEKETYERYDAFFSDFSQCVKQDMTQDGIATTLHPKYGKTYLWDYFALRDIKSY